ncbi:MAG: hypothetical protein D6765_14370 [Bacteroidetes bacterium]|nr:MAG: hypothetical protein D6765_14370 [Bacteroidota bacterium]
MKDNYFFDKLKRILGNPPPTLPNEAAWQRMAQRLDAGGAKVGWWRYPAVRVAAVVLPLLLLNGWLFCMLRQTQSRLAALEKQSSVLAIDTLYRKVVVVDTVFYGMEGTLEPKNGQTHEESYGSTDALSFLAALNKPAPSFRLDAGRSVMGQGFEEGGLGETHWIRGLSSVLRRSEALSGERGFQPQTVPHVLPPLSLQRLQSLRQGYLPASDVAPPHQDMARKFSLRRWFQPQGWALEGTGSLWFPRQIGGIEGSGWSAGPGLQVDFRQGFRLRTGLQLNFLEFKFKNPEEEHPFPPTPPRNPDDQLHEIYADYYRLHLPLTLELPLLKKARVRPFFGAGTLLDWSLRREFTYEWKEPGGEEYKEDFSFGVRPPRMKTLLFNAGLEGRLWKGWHLRLEGRFLYDLEAREPTLGRLAAPGLQVSFYHAIRQR